MIILRYVRRTLHSSWQIFAACIGVFVGVLLAPVVPFDLWSVAWLLTGIALISSAAIKQITWMVVLALVGGMLVGLWRGQIEQAYLTKYEPLYGAEATLKGKVSEDPDTDDRGNTTVRLKDISYGGSDLAGKIWVSFGDKKEIKRSDIVTISGKLQPGFGTFAGVVYRAEILQVERPTPGDVALRVRDWFADAVRVVTPEPQASLGIGYLVGQRRSLPEQLDTALRVAGLTHIVVASGYNLTILVRLTRRLFAKISKYLSMLVSSGLVVSFIAVTGMSPSMSRAGLVAGLSLAAWYYGRRFNPFVILMLAVAITVMVNPSYAWGDVGWQLSFAAFAGVMIFAPLFQAYYFGESKPGIVRQILGETFSAWLCTLPILMYTFGQLSTVAIIANMLVLPFVPLAMLLTFIVGVSVLAVPLFSGIFSWFATSLLFYMTSVASYLAALPWATVEVEIKAWHVIVLYVGIVAAVCYMWWQTKFDLSRSSVIE